MDVRSNRRFTDAGSVTNCRSEITRREQKDDTGHGPRYQRLAGLCGVMTSTHNVEAPTDSRCPAETINQASNNGQSCPGRGRPSQTRDLEDNQTCRRFQFFYRSRRPRGDVGGVVLMMLHAPEYHKKNVHTRFAALISLGHNKEKQNRTTCCLQ